MGQETIGSRLKVCTKGHRYLVLAHLFVKVPRPGGSEGTFRSLSQLPPVTTNLTTQS